MEWAKKCEWTVKLNVQIVHPVHRGSRLAKYTATTISWWLSQSIIFHRPGADTDNALGGPTASVFHCFGPSRWPTGSSLTSRALYFISSQRASTLREREMGETLWTAPEPGVGAAINGVESRCSVFGARISLIRPPPPLEPFVF